MSCDCNNDRVELLIKQGEQRSYIFNITSKSDTKSAKSKGTGI